MAISMKNLLNRGTKCAVITALSLAACVGVKPVFAKEKVLYLTFDDGPGAIYTPQVLDVLEQEHVQATFFVLGYRCIEFPGLIHRIQHDHDEIGNHGYDHRDLSKQPATVLQREVKKADDAIFKVSGEKPLYYRPAYGGVKREELPTIRDMGHSVMFWTVDSLDWQAHSASDIVRNVEKNAKPGSIILFHDGINNSRLTIQALPTIISHYRAQGYEFQTLPDLTKSVAQ